MIYCILKKITIQVIFTFKSERVEARGLIGVLKAVKLLDAMTATFFTKSSELGRHIPTHTFFSS